MINSLISQNPDTPLIAVGFSLGANIICKYLGEDKSKQVPFVGCISLCQGYDFLRYETRFVISQFSSELSSVCTFYTV